MYNLNSESVVSPFAHEVALASWRRENPCGSFCGQADPLAYCGKPLVRACDYHNDCYLARSAVS